MEEWQAKRSAASSAPRLTTGFLDGTHPIVDAYELKVQRQHCVLLITAERRTFQQSFPTLVTGRALRCPLRP